MDKRKKKEKKKLRQGAGFLLLFLLVTGGCAAVAGISSYFTGADRVTRVFSADLRSPALTVKSPDGLTADEPAYVPGGSCLVTGTASDQGSGLAGVTVNQVEAAVDGGGEWSAEIPLKENQSTQIVIVATDQAGRTTTETRYVYWDSVAPQLEITEPAGTTQDAPVISSEAWITVSGTAADDGSQIAGVTVNGQSVNVNPDGSWEAEVDLQPGENTIVVEVTDGAGNRTGETIHVIRRQEGQVVLSEESGHLTYPDSTTITVEKNLSGGVLTVSSSDPDVAVAAIRGTTVTVYSGTKEGAAVITVTSGATDGYLESQGIYEVTVSKGTLYVSAQGYTGVYDGAGHGICVDCPGAVITYAQTEDGVYVEEEPVYTDAGDYIVYYQVTKAGYVTVTGQERVTIQKAPGALELSAEQGILVYPATETIAVSQNSSGGTLTAVSSDPSVADVEVYGAQIRVTTGSKAGGAVITVTAAATANYQEAVATYTVIADREGPQLTIRSPQGASQADPTFTVAEQYAVSGAVTDDYGIQSVAVNGVEMAVEDDGSWCGEVSLTADGIVQALEVVATDLAGRTTVETRYVVVPKDTVVDENNRTYAGYRGVEQEELVIASVFRDGTGTWCRPVEIGAKAFNGCGNLIGVEIPDTVTSIGRNAFTECVSLTQVNIPESVQTIGASAFYKCEMLKKVEIPDAVTDIGDWAFAMCYGLTELKISQSVTSLGSHVFCDCYGLPEVEIPEGVTYLGNYVFSGCDGLTEVVIPDTVKEIDGSAFANCEGLLRVTLPEGLTVIPYAAFRGCTALSRVEIPHAVSTLESYAFYGCTNLSQVQLGQQVCVIDDYAFYQCGALQGMELPTSVSSIGDYAFYECTSLTEILMPPAVTAVGKSAFYGCTGLTDVSISDGVTVIEANTFEGCSGLEHLYMSARVTSIGDKAFSKCAKMNAITLPDTLLEIGENAFFQCDGLLSVTIPDSVTFMDKRAFCYCLGLKEVVIGDGVTSLEYGTFYNCKKLVSVTVGISVTSIGENAFERCYGLKYVYYAGTQEQWNAIVIDSYNEDLTGATFYYSYVAP